MYKLRLKLEGKTKEDPKEEYIRCNSFNKTNLIGHLLFQLLNIDLNDTSNIRIFLEEWDVKKINLYTGTKKKGILITDLLNNNDLLRSFNSEISYMKRAISLWLRIDNPKKESYSNPFLSNDSFEEVYFKEYNTGSYSKLSPSRRFDIFLKNLSIPVNIKNTLKYTMSESTKYNQKIELENINREINKKEDKREKLQQKKDKYILNTTGEISEDNPLGIIDDTQVKLYNEEIKELDNEINSLRTKYGIVKSKGWKVCTQYEVTDIISLCWLEILIFVQNDIKARRCSLCGKLYIIYNKNSSTRCPECGQNNVIASRRYRQKQKIIKKVRQKKLTEEEASFKYNLPLYLIQEWTNNQ